ncbi:MAG TPA: hypothetical protein VGO93_11135, partial [Candidatus Xenobia bacterium]
MFVKFRRTLSSLLLLALLPTAATARDLASAVPADAKAFVQVDLEPDTLAAWRQVAPGLIRMLDAPPSTTGAFLTVLPGDGLVGGFAIADPDQARTFLQRLKTRFGLMGNVANGYALIANSPAALDQVRATVAGHALSDTPSYQACTQKLGATHAIQAFAAPGTPVPWAGLAADPDGTTTGFARVEGDPLPAPQSSDLARFFPLTWGNYDTLDVAWLARIVSRFPAMQADNLINELHQKAGLDWSTDVAQAFQGTLGGSTDLLDFVPQYVERSLDPGPGLAWRYLDACQHNLLDIRQTLERYRKQHGHYPEALVHAPRCPATPHQAYAYERIGQTYRIFCRGHHHPGVPPDHPAYQPAYGLNPPRTAWAPPP